MQSLNWAVSLIIIISADGVFSISRGCGQVEYENCVRMADPLLTDAHMIFPDNMVDIDNVCKKWTLFVDCIREYTDNCFTEHRRQQFNQAVEIAVDSVHQMCTSSEYQTEYLQHATCLKNTLTDDRYCGRHYRHLTAQVQGNRDMARDDLCCSHFRFRECVLTETKRICDTKYAVSSKMLPSAFSKQVLDKALSFLKEQCAEYTPSPGECIGYPSSNRIDQAADEYSDTTHIVGPSYTYSVGNTHEVVGSKQDMPETPATLNPLTWIPSRDGRRRTTDMEGDSSTSNEPSTRSSFGRGVTWGPSTNNDDPFKATHYKPSTEAWYPGNNINYQKEVEDFNTIEVEEPNQQGLTNFDKNTATAFQISIVLLIVQFIFFKLF